MFEPDDFKSDWYGWLTNQCGHFVLGLMMVTWLWLLNFDPLYSAIGSILFYIAIEAFVQKDNRLWDAATDTMFVGLGAFFFTFASYSWAGLIMVDCLTFLIAILVGCYARKS